jgi:hypothetical protein
MLFAIHSAPARAQCEQAKLTASDAEPSDAFGTSVSADGDYIVVGVPNEDDAGTDAGAVYVFRREGNKWVEEAKLTADDGAADDGFGRAVSIRGEHVLVGAPYDDNTEWRAGAAYVFRRTGTGWIREGKLTAAGTDLFGWAVAIDTDRALVSSMFTASAYVFRREGNTWIQEAILTGAYTSGVARFGWSVALTGDLALVGATWEGTGSAYVFRYNGTCWVQEARLTPADGNSLDEFGDAVAVYGNRVFVGAPNGRSDTPGAVYVFRLDDTGWVEEAKLTPRDGQRGDRFGTAIAVDGDYLQVGARWDDTAAPNSGAAYVFRRDGANWVEEAKLTASDAANGDGLGYALASSGGRTIVGAPANDELGDGAGAVYVFRVAGSPDCDLDGINDSCEADCNANGNPDGCDIVDGISDDCDADGIPDECEPDCNTNDVADSCDVRDGASDDCNANGVPDECEPPQQDCNTNGTADGCDLTIGTSEDCTGNGIPDECEPDCNENTVADGCDILYRVSEDCDHDGVPDECQPPHPDCNGNGVSDGCDLTDSTSPDCNENNIPDECDLIEGTSEDCNANERPDECDVADGTSRDCNDNGVPDECEPCGGPTGFSCPAGQFCKFCVGECGTVGTTGSCRSIPQQGCPLYALPVCGCDGVGYGNDCFADVAGVSLAHYGWCGNPPVDCCLPTGGCIHTTARACRQHGGAQVSACLGDVDGDHMDDACDCNRNGYPDGCDILNGTSDDCNANYFPDECERDEDCNTNGVQDICDIADGTSQDCTGNGVPDECEPDCNQNTVADNCDIADGTSEDCTGNDIPDECEPDCNLNGTADSCDILAGTSQDMDEDGIPDECENWSLCRTGEGYFDYTPHRADPEAEFLAMTLTGQLRAPDEEYERIHRDLALIRAVCPGVADIKDRREYRPDQILVRLVSDVPHDDYDALNTFYQVVDDKTYRYVTGLHLLTFCDNINIPFVVPEYEAFPDVQYAEPNWAFGDGDNITVTPDGTTYRYEIVHGYGDCMSGCIYHDTWLFDVEADGTVVLTYSDEPCCPPTWVPSPPLPELIADSSGALVPSYKNRFLSFMAAGDSESRLAVRATFSLLPPPFHVLNGQSMWVGEPREVCENAGQGPGTLPEDCVAAPGSGSKTFLAAPLVCDASEAHWADWSQYGRVHIYHEALVPGGTYELATINAGCATAFDGNYSPALTVTTAIWGDIVRNCTTDPCGPPNGTVDIIDVTAVLDKFRNLPGAPIKARCDLVGIPPNDGKLDLVISILDVTAGLNAFVGGQYTFPPGDPCP